MYVGKHISGLGITSEMPNVEKVKIKIINIGLVATALIQVFIFLWATIKNNEWNLPIIYGIFLLTCLLLFFNAQGRTLLTKFIINLIFPPLLTLSIYVYGPQLHVEYAFFILIITSIIFHEQRWVRIALLLYNLLMYLAGTYVSWHYNSPWADKVYGPDFIPIFVSTAICIILVIRIYLLENVRHEQRMDKLLKKLEAQNDYLLKAYQEIERFAHIASHDLKGPLRTINNYITLLELELAKGNKEKREEYIDFIQESTRKMVRMMEDLLSYSKIDQLKHPEKDKVDLEALVHETATELPNEKQKQIIVNTDRLPTLNLHRLYWKILIQNLIENGVKYNDKHIIKIDIEHELENDVFQLHIKDNGIGIPEKHQGDIFQMFSRLHREKEYPGTGIGLAICQKIVEKMNGEIKVQSELGEGSCFSIIIPLCKKTNLFLQDSTLNN
jgi:signal transduction histidine kinase